jgi:thymidylate synthase ThyX
MTKPRRIYLLSPKDLSPETIAVTFAKTSRSPQPFDEIAEELNDLKSARFHEKWVVGYGHASVAEHAVLHLALENVSRLAIETIEGNRLASYTEKSTRYQQWDKDAYYVPDEIKGHALEPDYREVCQLLFSTYGEVIPQVERWLRYENPQEVDETDSAYERRIKPAAVDICRFWLPAAALANVGVTINARALEYAICKMLSSPLDEVQKIGERIREVGQKETPTLIKYAACNNYLVETRERMQVIAADINIQAQDESLKLHSFHPEGENEILAAVLFRFNQTADYQSCLDFVRGLNREGRDHLIHELMDNRGRFDQPLREFEYAQMTFEAVMDQGAYFEFKRHRMMTQTVKPLTANLGVAVPSGIVAAGCESEYRTAMQQAADVYHQLAEWNPDVASYVVPNGFNRRVLFTMNLREAFTFCRLRAAENAHFSIRRLAFRVAESIRSVYPSLYAFMDLPQGESWEEIEKENFSSLSAK